MYLPRGKKLKLAGIRVSNLEDGDQILSEPSAVQSALRDYWGTAYAFKDFDCVTANKLMGYYVVIKEHEF